MKFRIQFPEKKKLYFMINLKDFTKENQSEVTYAKEERLIQVLSTILDQSVKCP